MNRLVEDFLKPDSDQPRAVFTIGVPGSGKSVVCRRALQFGYHVINADELRVLWLQQMQSRNEHITIAGQKELADPHNSKHVFSDELRTKVRNPANLFSKAAGHTRVLWDLTNLTLDRVYLMDLCRQNGYSVEAVVFGPATTEWHMNNVAQRVAEGGLDLASSNLSSEEKNDKRRHIIDELKRTFRIFSAHLSVDSAGAVPTGTLPVIETQSFRRPSKASHFNEWLAELPEALKPQMQAIKSRDVFQKVLWIDCQQSV